MDRGIVFATLLFGFFSGYYIWKPVMIKHRNQSRKQNDPQRSETKIDQSLSKDSTVQASNKEKTDKTSNKEKNEQSSNSESKK